MMFELTADLVMLLMMAAFAAGFVDAIAGGGGLITLPILMLAGLSPAQALATNKVQGVFGAGTAALSYAARGLVDLRSQWKSALIAGAAGAVLFVAMAVLSLTGTHVTGRAIQLDWSIIAMAATASAAIARHCSRQAGPSP